MLPKKPKSKSEQRRLEIQLASYKKEQEKQQASMPSELLPVDPSLPIAIIVDIDGTLAKRDKEIRGVYDFDKSIHDATIPQTKYILELIDDANKWINQVVGKTHIILITGREDKFKDVTNNWLFKHQIPFDHLYMRRTGDRRKSSEVKKEIWAGNIRGKYNVLWVFDDRKQDIDMYRSIGLYCFEVDNSRELLDKKQ